MSEQWPSPTSKSQKDASDASSGEPSRTRTPPGIWAYRIVAAGLAVAVVVIFTIKHIDNGKLEAQLIGERAACAKQASSALSSQAEELLRLAALATSRAIGAAMQGGDRAATQELIETMVKERYVSSISVADESGTIVAATNKKWEDANLAGVFPGALDPGKDVTVRQSDDSFLAFGPITREEQRIGTIVLVYNRATVAERMPEPGKP